jgi:hypothetical protein
MIGKCIVVALVDTGNSGTFIDTKFALIAGCKVSTARTMNVIVANGAELKGKASCTDCQYTVQGYKFKNDFRLLQLKGYDIILGTDWMLTHKPLKWDFRTQALKIRYYGLQKVVFTHESQSLECTVISSETVEKALSQAGLGVIIYANKQSNTPEEIPAAVSDLLQEFPRIFSEPEHLPPSRECDHQIVLQPGPHNKRAYRLHAYQKDALEKILEQLIRTEVIRLIKS